MKPVFLTPDLSNFWILSTTSGSLRRVAIASTCLLSSTSHPQRVCLICWNIPSWRVLDSTQVFQALYIGSLRTPCGSATGSSRIFHPNASYSALSLAVTYLNSPLALLPLGNQPNLLLLAAISTLV